mmetsp:Transcript_20775/g.35680  ORF Transcript_20775/g.35680 Transcript_20775/m.35680 type:complete len:200 (-) Transcript_20775:1001-1600(-)
MRASQEATGSLVDTSALAFDAPDESEASGPCIVAFLIVTLAKLSPKSFTCSFILMFASFSSPMRWVNAEFFSVTSLSLPSSSFTLCSYPAALLPSSCSLSSISSAELALSSSSRSCLEVSREVIIFCSVAIVSTLTWCSAWSFSFVASTVLRVASFATDWAFNSLMVASRFALPSSNSLRASRRMAMASFPSSTPSSSR